MMFESWRNGFLSFEKKRKKVGNYSTYLGLGPLGIDFFVCLDKLGDKPINVNNTQPKLCSRSFFSKQVKKKRITIREATS